jgi:signal transduction histidine kinase
MTNAAKHADATLIRVSVVASDDTVEVVVTDDGKGGAAARPGSGLTGLGDRVEALRGRFAFDSPPGGGTTIRARFPI